MWLQPQLACLFDKMDEVMIDMKNVFLFFYVFNNRSFSLISGPPSNIADPSAWKLQSANSLRWVNEFPEWSRWTEQRWEVESFKWSVLSPLLLVLFVKNLAKITEQWDASLCRQCQCIKKRIGENGDRSSSSSGQVQIELWFRLELSWRSWWMDCNCQGNSCRQIVST